LAGKATAQVEDGSGCIGCNPETEKIGVALEQSFALTDSELLKRQTWAGTICENHPCISDFGVLDEEHARDLLQSHLSSRQRSEDRWLTVVSTGIAALSVIASVFALWQTHAAKREARAASDRSIRNEARIERLSEEN
jgi:hypothetical protein